MPSCATLVRGRRAELTQQPRVLKRVLVSLQLRSGGSQILEGCIAEIPNISSLDISDNGGTASLFVNFNEGPVRSV